jgi:hypothetical protein
MPEVALVAEVAVAVATERCDPERTGRNGARGVERQDAVTEPTAK